MLRLREKAHTSLNNFRAGKTPSTSGHLTITASPVDNDVDELSTLGGRTRVVTRADSTGLTPPGFSPALSPGGAARVVPVPLFSSGESAQQVHPNVLDYIRTFAPAPHPKDSGVPTGQGPVQGYTTSPQQSYDMSAFGMTPAGAQASGVATPYMSNGAHVGAGQAYPQYFPVFDYGPPAGGENAYPPMTMDPGGPPSSSSGPRSESPHSAWNAFVAQLGM